MKEHGAAEDQTVGPLGIGDDPGLEQVAGLHAVEAAALIDIELRSAQHILDLRSAAVQGADMKQAAVRRAQRQIRRPIERRLVPVFPARALGRRGQKLKRPIHRRQPIGPAPIEHIPLDKRIAALAVELMIGMHPAGLRPPLLAGQTHVRFILRRPTD